MKLTNREKILLPSALLIIAAALFLNFVYLPLSKEVSALKTQALDNDLRIDEEQAKESKIKSLKEKLTTVQKDFEVKHEDFLQVWDQPELISFVEDTISPFCVKKSIDFFDAVSVDAIRAGEINLVFKSDYNSLRKILQKFEEAKYYSTITTMDITGSDTTDPGLSESDQLLQVSLNIRFYAKNLNDTYPKDYDFMAGSYGKTNIFE